MKAILLSVSLIILAGCASTPVRPAGLPTPEVEYNSTPEGRLK